MAYCVSSDVRLIVNTTLTDVEITGIIEMSDAEIDARIGTQTSGNKLIKKLSMLLTAHTIKTRQPQSQAIGEYREDAGDVLEVWEREIERIYRLYKGVSVKATEHRYIDESKRYPEES
jgi:hypothetical protein